MEATIYMQMEKKINTAILFYAKCPRILDHYSPYGRAGFSHCGAGSAWRYRSQLLSCRTCQETALWWGVSYHDPGE